MQYQVSKKTLLQQVRPPIREKKLKNQDRILYVNGLFNPPPAENSESVMEGSIIMKTINIFILQQTQETLVFIVLQRIFVNINQMQENYIKHWIKKE